MGVAKRLVASWLNVIVEALRVIPGTSEYIYTIEVAAGFFGITGIGHAGVKGTISKKKTASASAAVASLIALSYVFPVLIPFRPFLEKLAAILGAAAIGANLSK
jgi:hypothetical protein